MPPRANRPVDGRVFRRPAQGGSRDPRALDHHCARMLPEAQLAVPDLTRQQFHRGFADDRRLLVDAGHRSRAAMIEHADASARGIDAAERADQRGDRGFDGDQDIGPVCAEPRLNGDPAIAGVVERVIQGRNQGKVPRLPIEGEGCLGAAPLVVVSVRAIFSEGEARRVRGLRLSPRVATSPFHHGVRRRSSESASAHFDAVADTGAETLAPCVP